MTQQDFSRYEPLVSALKETGLRVEGITRRKRKTVVLVGRTAGAYDNFGNSAEAMQSDSNKTVCMDGPTYDSRK